MQEQSEAEPQQQELQRPKNIAGQKIKKKKVKSKEEEERTFSDRFIRLSMRLTRAPTMFLVKRIPGIRDDILRSNVNISPEGIISVAMFLAYLMIPVAAVGAFVMYSMHFDLGIIAMPLIPVIPLIGGISIYKVSASSRGSALENEIPYLIGYVTVLAGGGISPLVTIKRIAKAGKIFPAAAREARRILLDIEIFGLDPMSALEKAAKYTPNRMFSDFIGGYVAVLKSGGDAVSYLESKLKEVFNYREVRVRASSEFIGTMAEAYIISTVIMGVSFVILYATQYLFAPGAQSPDPTMMLLFSGVFVPVISMIFITVIGSSQIKEPIGYDLPMYIFLACTPIAAVFFFVPMGLPIYDQLGIGLALTSSPAAIVNYIHVKRNRAVESRLANFLRDISEIRKTGLSPEKTIETLAGRNYGGLTEHVKKISAQLSWGTPIRTVLENFSASVKSWITQAMAFLLLEVVDVGGGSSRMFIALADFTEKNAQLNKEKKSMVRPYLIIPYIGAIMVVVTTAMMIYFVSAPDLNAAGGAGQYLSSPAVMQETTTILLTASFFQAWVMGIVAGKMGENTVADGFKHATFLIIISLATVLIAQPLINTAG